MTTGQPIELSIVMPCLDEAETIETCVGKAQQFLDRAHIVGEVIVGDNGSRDGSGDLARRMGARVIDVQPRGYGSAISVAVAAARGRFVIVGDADDSYDFSNLGAFVDRLRSGCDLVIGNRFAGGIAPGAMPVLHRYVGNPVLTAIGRLFFGAPVHDFHCGLRGFRREAIATLDLRTTGMEFASEMIVKACLGGLAVAEVPTTLSRAGRSRPPHLQRWRDGWRHLRFLLLFAPHWLFLVPGLVLMTGGAALGLWLLPGPRRVGGLTVDVHSLVFAGNAIALGFQLVGFWALSKVFAVREGLLPPDPNLNALSRLFTLEGGLAVGGLLAGGGLAGSLYAVWIWDRQAFGDLDPTQVMRIVLPATVALTLGTQLIFTSFFLSLLGMHRQ